MNLTICLVTKGRDKYLDYSKKVFDLLNFSDIRGLFDDRNEKIGKKIRDAETKKIPFMLIIGEQEANEGSVSVRKHGEGDVGKFKLEEFISYFKEQLTVKL